MYATDFCSLSLHFLSLPTPAPGVKGQVAQGIQKGKADADGQKLLIKYYMKLLNEEENRKQTEPLIPGCSSVPSPICPNHFVPSSMQEYISAGWTMRPRLELSTGWILYNRILPDFGRIGASKPKLAPSLQNICTSIMCLQLMSSQCSIITTMLCLRVLHWCNSWYIPF